MPKAKKNRLAQTHKLASLSDHLSKATNFTSEEVRMLLLIHQKMEEIGPLDRNRFREILSIVFAITDDVMLDLVFRAFDHDQDGFINDIEWVRGMSTMLRGTLEQLTDFTYNVYDMNGDGSLAREELHHCLKGCILSGYGIDDDEIEDCERDIVEIAMKKLDTDRDGQITYEDFVRAVKKDALLLQACGCCIPSTRCASAFQSLITERYHLHSALYPKMPSARKDKQSRVFPGVSASSRGKLSKRPHSSQMLHLSSLSDREGSMAIVSTTNSSHEDIPVGPRASKAVNSSDQHLRRMSLSIVKYMQLDSTGRSSGEASQKKLSGSQGVVVNSIAAHLGLISVKR